MKIVFVNGPPRSGKDEVGKLFAGYSSGVMVPIKFAEELKVRCHGAYGIVDQLGVPEFASYFERCKDEPRDEFEGLTPRQAYIHFSEDYIKPIHGKGTFGRWLIRCMNEKIQTCRHGKYIDGFVVTDSGFESETVPVIKHFGASTCTLIQVTRDGCTYEGDSRSRIDLREYGVEQIDVYNPGDERLLANLKEAVPWFFETKVR